MISAASSENLKECLRTDSEFWRFWLGSGDLDQGAVAEQCGGTFMDLRKAFFLLTAAESPLVAKVRN